MRITVKLPKWWSDEASTCANPSEDILGFTDGVRTFLCSTTPCYFVEVPIFGYQGYFKISDLEVIGGLNEYYQTNITLSKGALKRN